MKMCFSFLQATDRDIGINAAFFYSILSGNSDNSFVIDSASGALSTAGPLDREEDDSYILLVRVSDLHGNQSYGVVFDDSTVVEVLVEVSLCLSIVTIDLYNQLGAMARNLRSQMCNLRLVRGHLLLQRLAHFHNKYIFCSLLDQIYS